MNKILDLIKNLSAPGIKKSGTNNEPAQTYQPQFESAEQPTSAGQTNIAQQDIQQNVQQSNIPDSTKKRASRAEQIEKKHKRFKRLVNLFKLSVIAIVGIIVVATVTRKIYIENKGRFRIGDLNGSNGDTPIVIKDDPKDPVPEENKFYKNDTYRFSVEYPSTNKLQVENYDDPDREFFIQLKSTENVPEETISGFSLIKGYLVSVNPLSITLRSFEDVVHIKRNWFWENCPETASIHKVTNIIIDDLPGLEFVVENCHSDFIYRYVRANQYIYEIAQIYKGDLGYKQLYKSSSRDIVSSIKIDRDGAPEPDPFAYYEHENFGFSFSYPSDLDSSCCNPPNPPGSKVEGIVSFAVETNDNVVGFFNDKDSIRKTLDEHVAIQKTLLIDDYTVIKGVPPQGIQREMVINNQRAIVLENYSWKENTLIYVELPVARSMLVISYKGFPQDKLNGILDSMIIHTSRRRR